MKSFILSKLLLLRDIWDNERHDFITSIQLWSKLNVKSNWISEWMLIKKAVPDSLMCALKHDNIISNSNNDLKLLNLKLYEQKGKLILPDALKSKVIIKQHLAQKFREPLKTETKWQVKLQDNAMNWKSIWNNVFDSYCFNSCKEFQWKFIHNVVFTEQRLFLMGYSNGICNLCSNNIETIRHLFFECSKIQHLWKVCIGKMKVFVPNEQLSLTYTLLVIGSVNSKHKTIINTFLFETKFMIWKCRNYKKYEHSEVFLTKSHKYLDAKLNSILLYNNIVDCDMH